MISSVFRRAVHVSLLALTGTILFPACSSKNAPSETATHLPYYGDRAMQPEPISGPADTIFTVPSFTLTNQDRKTITNDTFKGKIYVTDFFFATCPSICPKMQSELLRVYEKFQGDPRVLFLSHTIDPAHDSIPVLRDYAERLGIKDASRWHFATAPHDTIFSLARAYMTGAMEDATVKGGFAHSGTFALVDPQRHIRGVYDGMEPSQVNKLMQDIPVLLKEIEAEKQTAAR
ncbi:SCO family protein [Hymenobacter crusticola]|uniref:SCO family protein n=1 Tax=Hymenobacter crusticola TaxID=1770526 RepID=A0A243WC07_9BACT|nr:SCO family protein [Hymenobacter crusticola]OUJ72271.1 SCO family protein [Hymenobacter crusticola]